MKKRIFSIPLFTFFLFLTSFCALVSSSCQNAEKPLVVKPPSPGDTAMMAAQPQIIIEDIKVMLHVGTGMSNCTCSGSWSSLTTLTNATVTKSLPLSFSGIKPRKTYLVEVQLPNNLTGQFKMGFDKGCNVLKHKGCVLSSIAQDKSFVKISKNSNSVNVKPTFDLNNTASFAFTPSNCNGCKVRYKACTGSFNWVDCASNLAE